MNPPAIRHILRDPDLVPILSALPRARLVGGCVRDSLAGRPIADIDLATPDPPDRILAALAAAGLHAVPTGIAHGTVTALSGGRPFEITTLRRDEETDGRHARVAWTDDFCQDAARRDFTINAMSLDQSGTLHDYFGGAADLAAGRVRFVGDPAGRIAEDYLRVLRFFRFYGRYGIEPPDRHAASAIAAAAMPPASGLARLSAERVWSEVRRILQIPDPSGSLSLMAELGVLAACLPEATNIAALRRLVAIGAPADPILRLAALATGSLTALADRLRLSNAERERLNALRASPAPDPADSDAELRRRLAMEPAGILLDRTWLAGDAGMDWQGLRDRLAAMPVPSFPLEGRHALALGASPGPHIGKALRRVRHWWMEDGCRAGEAALLRHLQAELQASD